MNPQKFDFNEHGLLIPAEAISSDLEALQHHFVAAFPKSKTRKELFKNLMLFNEIMQKEVFAWYEVWVDGSFVTKKLNPKDLDVVVFLEYEVYEMREKKLMHLMAVSFDTLRIDAYFVKVYQRSHPLLPVTMINRNDWFEFFTTTRGENKKGFLKLNFGR